MAVKSIDRFYGEYRFLSNFYPCGIEMEGVTYPTLEHAYQASKTSDLVGRIAIRMMGSPGMARAAGRSRVVIRDLPPDWDARKSDIMLGLLRKKFAIPELRDKLLATGDADLIGYSAIKVETV